MKFLLAFFVIAFSTFSIAAPNPASVNCKNKGGKLIPVTSKEGTYSLCAFGTGKIEEWTLLKHNKGNKNQGAVKSFLRSNSWGDTASVNCEAQGGKVIKDKLVSGRDVEVCDFEDGSTIEVNTLFEGAASKSNKKLFKALEE